MNKYSKKNLFFIMVMAATLAGLGVVASKSEAQSQSTVGCPTCGGSACSSVYEPQGYRPGTSGWTGQVGQIAFNNSTRNSVRVTLYHPDAPRRAFNSWNVRPGQNLFLGRDNYGMDWGIQLNGSAICILGSVSDWNSFNGSKIFQTWVERVLR